MEYDYLFKIVIVGDSGVGKSTLLRRYVDEWDDSVLSSYLMTIGVDFRIRSKRVGKKGVRCQLWDTGGTERFRTIVSSYFRGASGFVIVYDVTNQASFDSLQYWIHEIDSQLSSLGLVSQGTLLPLKLVVANKCHCVKERTVSFERGALFAQEYGTGYIETSAEIPFNVDLCFDSLIDALVHHHQGISDSSTDVIPDGLSRLRKSCKKIKWLPAVSWNLKPETTLEETEQTSEEFVGKVMGLPFIPPDWSPENHRFQSESFTSATPTMICLLRHLCVPKELILIIMHHSAYFCWNWQGCAMETKGFQES